MEPQTMSTAIRCSEKKRTKPFNFYVSGGMNRTDTKGNGKELPDFMLAWMISIDSFGKDIVYKCRAYHGGREGRKSTWTKKRFRK